MQCVPVQCQCQCRQRRISLDPPALHSHGPTAHVAAWGAIGAAAVAIPPSMRASALDVVCIVPSTVWYTTTHGARGFWSHSVCMAAICSSQRPSARALGRVGPPAIAWRLAPCALAASMRNDMCRRPGPPSPSPLPYPSSLLPAMCPCVCAPDRRRGSTPPTLVFDCFLPTNPTLGRWRRVACP